MTDRSDFTKGSVAGNILRLAVPMIIAQIINVLYSVVDRMYIGHLPDASASALTGVGVTFPVISIIMAFANLFGTGGTPLFSIARGRGDDERAERIMGNTFTLLVGTGLLLTAVILVLKRPLLYLFGASDVTFPFANDYLTLYLCGSVFVMIGLGMNGFINAQGFSGKGMLTVVLGAVVNIALDPLFIFVFHMGVRGAALATVIAQFVSAAWAVSFLAGKRTLLRLRRVRLRPEWPLVREVAVLGLSGFIMNITNSAVQIVCNATLQAFGGDLYVGVMTVVNSVREVATAPINGLTGAAQPVLGYNYGAGQFRRVRRGIGFLTVLCCGYTLLIWLCILLFPQAFIRPFSGDSALIAAAVPAMHVYFFGFFMMALQMSGQTAAVALGRSKQAIFFSLLRKAVIVVPLTLLLPGLWGLGVNGVFLAEPISNFIGGGACYLTMLFTIWAELRRGEKGGL
jgi:putative MATE family efflux protein